MSLCPSYCNCPSCGHGISQCEPCKKCREESEQREHQKEHEISVRKQKAKLKIAPWRTVPSRPDFIGS